MDRSWCPKASPTFRAKPGLPGINREGKGGRKPHIRLASAHNSAWTSSVRRFSNVNSPLWVSRKPWGKWLSVKRTSVVAWPVGSLSILHLPTALWPESCYYEYIIVYLAPLLGLQFKIMKESNLEQCVPHLSSTHSYNKQIYKWHIFPLNSDRMKNINVKRTDC